MHVADEAPLLHRAGKHPSLISAIGFLVAALGVLAVATLVAVRYVSCYVINPNHISGSPLCPPMLPSFFLRSSRHICRLLTPVSSNLLATTPLCPSGRGTTGPAASSSSSYDPIDVPRRVYRLIAMQLSAPGLYLFGLYRTHIDLRSERRSIMLTNNSQ